MGWLRFSLDLLLHATHLDTLPFLTDTSGDAQHPLNPGPAGGGEIIPSIIDSPPSIQTITCSYPELEKKGWELCNSENSRDCWIRDSREEIPEFTQWDLKTNYEDDVPPGITREYWLDVTGNLDISPDGEPKLTGKYFNATYPGPLIEACWGDDIVIHVTNKRQDNGTTIHWHGIRQLFTNEMDGVNGITQCPIAPDDTFTYKFRATQYGTTWYHSHYSSQYPDGLAGPMIIHGPHSADWDIELEEPIFIQDWIHDSAFHVYEQEMAGGVPVSNTTVINGVGLFEGSGSRYETCLTPGKKHLLRLINGSAGTSYLFTIDDHILTVVAVDLVAVEPFNVTEIFLSIGQRYTVILQPKEQQDQPPATGNYWLRTVPADGCSSFGSPHDERTGIIRYSDSSSSSSSSSNTCSRELPANQTLIRTTKCTDMAPELINPIVPWCVDQHPQNNVTANGTFHAGLQDDASQSPGPPDQPYRHWHLAPKNPMWLNFSKPTILNVDEAVGDPDYAVIEEKYDHGFIYLVIDGSELPAAHPIHLHGSDFVILSQTDQPWDPSSSSPNLNLTFDNPPRRDTALLPAGGTLVISFKPDNPGSWLLHCHIAWHAGSGLALQMLVRPKDIPNFLGHLREVREGCEAWKGSELAGRIVELQDDSGI